MGQEDIWSRVHRRAAAAVLSFLAGVLPSPLGALVISEIHYHPPAGEEGLEFIEIENELATPEDISGYTFTGIDYRFPPGTILNGKGILVVCADAAAVKARYGIQNVLGNFRGRLDAGGERVAVLNHAGVALVSVRYNDRGKWPAAPDGTGHTLALRSPYLDPSEPESWAPSLALGGTPGLSNFPAGGRGAEDALVFNELRRGAEPGGGWVEIHNRSAVAVDLAGHRLTADPELPGAYTFPPGSSIESGQFLKVDEAPSGLPLSTPEVRLFLLTPAGTAAAAAVFDRTPPAGSGPGGWSECRFPDGGPLEWVTRTPTPGAPNRVAGAGDVVINEIFYHPPEERPGEFIELLNRGEAPADASGFTFDRGVSFTIPEGTVIAPGGYLVIAEDPELLLLHYGLEGALGPYEGRLANDGENVRLLDRDGNVVDEVRYHEGGDWSRWADGRGASLELLDPLADNSSGSAWQASDEIEKTRWEKLSFNVPAYVVSGETELHFYLVERGVCRIDDVSITRGAGANLIPNPGFETSTAPWVLQGTHVHSRRLTTDSHSGSACLEIVASGKGDTLQNRIETDTAPRLTAGPYEVSLWARWIRGSSVIVAHGEYSPGQFGGRPSPATNLSGNTLQKGLRMTVPWNLGTPGAENSARLALRLVEPAGNLGPTIDGVEHRPAAPAAGKPVAVTARIADRDGVPAPRAHYRVGSPAGAFLAADLFDDGLHADGAAGDGLFGGEFPSQAAGTRVVFYIEAADGKGAVRRYPADAPARTLLYQVLAPAGPGIDSGRLVLDTQRAAELTSRPLHSNDLLPGTFVFNDEEVYYQVGLRYRGSPWGRPGRNNFRVRFEEDRPFLRGRQAINLDNSGPSPNEGACYFLCSRNSGPDRPAAAGEYAYIRNWLNGNPIGIHGLLQPVDRDFITAWYGDPGLALALKVEGRRAFTDAGTLLGWDGASFIYRTEDKEDYRDYVLQGIRRSADIWAPLIALCKVMDRRASPNPVFDEKIDTVLDVEAFLRVFAPRVLQSDWDAFCVGNGHNGYLVLDPRDQRWEMLPFDMDNTFSNPSINFFPAADPDVARLLTRPAQRRLYFRILWEYIAGYWSSARAGPYLDALQRATAIGFVGIKSYLTTTSAQVRNVVQTFTTTVFKIITNEGKDIATGEAQIELSGDAPIQVVQVLYHRNDEDYEPLRPVWTTPSRWKAVFALPETENVFEFLAFDAAGNLTHQAAITVRTTAHLPPPALNSLSPNRGPIGGGTLVTLGGDGFFPGMQVLFGGVPSPRVAVRSRSEAEADSPPAPSPPPAGGAVDVEVVVSAGRRVLAPKAFTYTLAGGFVRGDSMNDGRVDIGDPIALLFHLYSGPLLLCEDAADFDDSGALDLTDAIAGLDYLFRAGAAPRSPFPGPGQDSTPDGLSCPVD